MSQLREVLNAAGRYAAGFQKGHLTIPPARRLAVLTCMDARIDPAKLLGLEEGDAHIIRNAGGRASDDALRSLVISHKLLGTREWLVIHHSDCGMLTFTNEVMSGLLERSLQTASFDGKSWSDQHPGPGSSEGRYIQWLPFSNLEESVVDDVRRIRSHPLVPGDIPIYGFVYDVKSGRLIEVQAAMQAGAAR